MIALFLMPWLSTKRPGLRMGSYVALLLDLKLLLNSYNFAFSFSKGVLWWLQTKHGILQLFVRFSPFLSNFQPLPGLSRAQVGDFLH